MAKRAYVIGIEIILVILALMLGYHVSDHWSVIPKWLVNIPSPKVYANDLLVIAAVMLAAHVVVFVVLALVAGPGVFQQARRSAIEAYGLIVAVTVASLLLFLFFTIPYSPNLLLVIGLGEFALFLVAHVVGKTLAPPSGLSRSPLGALGALIVQGLRLAIRPFGIATLVFALAPLLLAKAYVADRDLANTITRLRMYFATAETTEWGMTNAFPGTRFLRPIQLRFSTNDDKTLYVLERDGALYRVPYTPGKPIPPESKMKLVDLREQLGSVEIENGALGFDLHPRFDDPASPGKGYVYVYYTEVKDGRQTNRLSRFDLSLPTIEARMASQTSLMALGRDASGFHNGGTVEFGPDGYLYLALGEATDKHGHQRLDRSLFGGILRIDVDKKGGDASHPIRRQPHNGATGNYFIPSDNPFSGRPDSMEEYWAIGLRNPFRVAFDRQTGKLWAGDVGSDVWEEVNVIQKGGNYQFPFMEGREEQPGMPRPAQVIGPEVPPVYTYRHTAFDRAVIGGIVYRGSKYPALRGQYLFCESYSGKILGFDANLDRAERAKLFGRSAEFVAQRGVTSLTQGPDGAILLTGLGRAVEPSGEILSLVPVAQALPKAPASQVSVAALLAEARSTFGADCARCHGVDGKGNGPDAKAMIEAFKLERMPDLTAPEVQRKRTDAELERVIKKGGPALGLSEGMPPWESVYGDPEIKAMVQYVRSLKQ